MIQNLIAITIVFLAAGYIIFSIIKNLTTKKTSHCSSCEGCSFKELPMIKHAKTLDNCNLQSKKFMPINHGK